MIESFGDVGSLDELSVIAAVCDRCVLCETRTNVVFASGADDADVRMVYSLDIFSGDVHSRRSRELYRLVFGEQVDIGVYAAKPNGFELNRWWQSSDGAKSVAAELLGWLMVKCCFNPGQPGSHDEN